MTFAISQNSATTYPEDKQRLELKFDSFDTVYDALEEKTEIYIDQKENRLVIPDHLGLTFYSIAPFRKMNYIPNSMDWLNIDLFDIEGTDTIVCGYFSDYSIKIKKNCDHKEHTTNYWYSNDKTLKNVSSRKLDKEDTEEVLKSLNIEYDYLRLESTLMILDIDTQKYKNISTEFNKLVFPEGFDILKHVKYIIVNYDNRCIVYTKEGKKVFEEKMASIDFYNNGNFILTSYEMISPLAKSYTGQSFAEFEIAKKHMYLLDFNFSNKQFVTSLKNRKRDGDKTRQLSNALKNNLLINQDMNKNDEVSTEISIETYVEKKANVFDIEDISRKKSYDNIIISNSSEQINLATKSDSQKKFKYEILRSYKDILVILKKEMLGSSKVSKNELLLIRLVNKKLYYISLTSFFSYLQIEDILLNIRRDNYFELVVFFVETSTNVRILEDFVLSFLNKSDKFYLLDNLTINFNGTRNHLNNEDEGEFYLLNNDFGYPNQVYKSYTNISYQPIDIENGSYYQYYDYEFPESTFFTNDITMHDILLKKIFYAKTYQNVNAANLEKTPIYTTNLIDEENLQVTYNYEKISKDDHLYVQKDTYTIKVAGKQQTIDLKSYSRKFGLEYAISPSVLLGFSNDMNYFLFYSNDNVVDGSLKVYDFEKGEFIFTKYIGSHRSSMNIDYFQGMSFSIFNERLIIRFNNVKSEIYDIKTSKKLADYYYYSDKEWYVVTPDGLYDKASRKTDKLYYVYDKKELFDLDQFKKEYQYSDLLSLVLGISDREYPKQINLQKEIKNLPPKISYEIIDNKTLKGTIQKREGDARDIFFCIAGIEKKEIRPTFDTQGIASFEIDLLKFKDDFVEGDNSIYVKAANTYTTITSKGPILNYTYQKTRAGGVKSIGDDDKDIPISTAKLYALFVGIENYHSNNLDYAEDDARDMKTCVELINKNLYTTDPEITYLTNDKAKKANIIKALKDIQEKADAEDVVLLYFSGHGITGEALEYNPKDITNRNFYFITEDFNDVTGESFAKISVDKNLQSEQAISSTELNYYLSGSDMNPQKKILIMDACYSGRILEPDPEPIAGLEEEKSDKNDRTRAQEKALQELNDKTGTIILTASRSNDKAYEAYYHQHSFLAWGLLKALKDKDYSEYGDNVKVDAWLNYAKYIVEHEIRDVKLQKPAISANEDVDFAIGSVKDDVLKDFTLAGALPIMYDAEIASTFQLRTKAKEIQSIINNTLRDYSENKEDAYKKFTYLKAELATAGYRIVGKISTENNTIKLSFYLSKNEELIELSMNPSTNPEYPYEIVFGPENLEKNISKFVKTIINQL